jgi:hypothetical protein
MDRDQRRRDPPALAQHDVVGADRRPGLHRIEHDAHGAQRLAKALWHHPDFSAGADDQRVDGIGGLEYARERIFVDLRRPGHLPGPDRIRQAQQ